MTSPDSKGSNVLKNEPAVCAMMANGLEMVGVITARKAALSQILSATAHSTRIAPPMIPSLCREDSIVAHPTLNSSQTKAAAAATEQTAFVTIARTFRESEIGRPTSNVKTRARCGLDRPPVLGYYIL